MKHTATISGVYPLDLETEADNELVRFYNGLIDNDVTGTRALREGALFRRGDPVAIHNPDNGVTIVRMAAGNGSRQAGLKRHELKVDYFGRLRLAAIDREQTYRLEIRPATRREIRRYYHDHPDLRVRMGARNETLANRLGILALLVSILSIVLALH